MGTAFDILLLVLFLVEVGGLVYVERRIWNSFYTPLTILALPFVGVLLLTIMLSKPLHFISFYYPSLLLWMIGLLLFALPSYLIGTAYRRNNGVPQLVLNDLKSENALLAIIGVLVLVFARHLVQTLHASAASFGTDDFADEFSKFGIYGHLLIFMSSVMICIFAILRKQKWFAPLVAILCITAIAFVNQVKSWVIIPLLSGFILRLMSGKAKMTWKLALSIVGGGIGLFFLSYLLMFTIGADKEYSDDMSTYILQHIYHYLSSGLLGMSMDMQQGWMEQIEPGKLFAPIVNIINALTGEEYVTAVNPIYFYTCEETALANNVRTMFGTIYAFSGGLGLLLVTPILSILVYIFRILSLKTHSVYIAAIDAWFCGLLFMSWFEYYFHNIRTFEVPVMLFMCYMISKIGTTNRTEIK